MKKAAAKAKRHIYGTGAAGMSNKGVEKPADRRNEEKVCPYCERIFKQLDRFNQHIVKCAKKHPEAAAAAAAQEQEQEQDAQHSAAATSAKAAERPARGNGAAASSGNADAAAAGSDTAGSGPASGAGDADGRPRYLQKTPKMLLMELIQKLKKHSKPKYYPGSRPIAAAHLARTGRPTRSRPRWIVR